MSLSYEDLLSGRVKLEFGNAEQIRVIKEHQALQELCDDCRGEGHIYMECAACQGTGKKIKK